MVDALILRFDAPLMSFGGAAVDNRGVIRRWPARSMVTGLLANALGYRRADAAALQRLQARARFAARCDRMGEKLVDYQTVDLGQPHMLAKDVGWTTRGRIEARGGASDDVTHIRQREYWADAVYTLALTLAPAEEAPDLDAVEAALRRPARPLFIGRKPCVPAGPVLRGRAAGADLVAVLEAVPRVAVRGERGALMAWWDAPDGAGAADPSAPVVEVTDERDWANQIHGGRRLVREGSVSPPEAV